MGGSLPGGPQPLGTNPARAHWLLRGRAARPSLQTPQQWLFWGSLSVCPRGRPCGPQRGAVAPWEQTTPASVSLPLSCWLCLLASPSAVGVLGLHPGPTSCLLDVQRQASRQQAGEGAAPPGRPSSSQGQSAANRSCLLWGTALPGVPFQVSLLPSLYTCLRPRACWS